MCQDHRDPLERKDTKGLRVSLETKARRVTLDGMALGAPRVKEEGWECPVFLASMEYREFPVHLDLGDLLAWTDAMEQREIQVAPASPVPSDLPVPPAPLVRQASKENLLTANPEVKERKGSQDETGKLDHQETLGLTAFQEQGATPDQKDLRVLEVWKDQWDRKATWASDSQETRENLGRKVPRVKRDRPETARSLLGSPRTALPAHRDPQE